MLAGVSGSPAVTGVVTPAGDYVLSEADGPADYIPGDWVCVGATAQDDDTVTLADGDNAVCTVTNLYLAPAPPDPTDPPVPPPAGGGLAQSGTEFPLLPAILTGLGFIGAGIVLRAARRQSATAGR